jgi:hypothetical protein
MVEAVILALLFLVPLYAGFVARENGRPETTPE